MATTIDARLHGGGSPATGEPAELTIVGSHIEVRAAGQVHTIQFDEIRVREVGLNRAGIELSWDAPEGTRALQVLDAAAVHSLRDNAAFVSLPQFSVLRIQQKRHAFGRSVGWTLLGALVFLPVLALLLFLWQSERIAHAAAERISLTDEVALGDRAFKQMRDSLELEDGGPAFDAAQSLGERLTRGSKYHYRIHVARSDVVNAFALPGGIIVINAGLIDATHRPEELAGVLAHEIQHVERRHSLVAMIKNMGLRGLWLLVTGDVGGGVFGSAVLELTSLNFSRDAEAEADARGFATLVAVGIDPSGMPDFFHTLARQDGASPPPFLSTHPASAEREQKLRMSIKELGQRRFQALDYGSWPPK